MRKAISRAALATGIAVAALPLGMASANAAPAAAEPAQQVGTAGMKFYDDYWTLKSCKTVGKWGLKIGKWSVYECQFSGWDWDLYYDK
ncbi:hypothetical protein ACIQUM_08065 [Amycolatopsis azurea]|uniref:hypothetical protein n=1 Tax=Amycolatopsis azurea TaxID=36819 RepID=UPI00381ABFC2